MSLLLSVSPLYTSRGYCYHYDKNKILISYLIGEKKQLDLEFISAAKVSFNGVHECAFVACCDEIIVHGTIYAK